MQEYSCSVEHVRGENNFVTDDFSRLMPQVREDKVDEADSSSSTDVDPLHPVKVDPVERVGDDLLHVFDVILLTEMYTKFSS